LARPQKTGLEYFPLDVDIDQDDKIQLIEARFGITGFAIVIKLFMKIYKEGYYYKWTEKEQLLFSKRINVDINLVNDVINECIKWGLFDSTLYEKYKILTSKGIQRRYLEATGRRKQVELIKEYCLIDSSKYSNVVFVSINSVNVNNNPQSDKVNDDINPKSKVKESKVEESKEEESNISTDDNYNSNNPFRYYQQNIGPLLPDIADLIDQYRKDLPDELITEAFKLAVKNNARSMRYAEKIMISWMDKGIRTMEDYRRHEAEWEHRKAAEAGREEAPAKRQYTQAEIEAAARYIKRAVNRYEGNDVLGFIYSLGYPQEVADGAVKLLCERKELVV